MSDQKNIDRLFQEKFKNFEANPNDAVWDKIHNRLHEDKRKRRVIPIWWKLGGVAAIIALIITISQFMFEDSISNTSVPDVVNTNTSKSPGSENTSGDAVKETQQNSITISDKKVNDSQEVNWNKNSNNNSIVETSSNQSKLNTTKAKTKKQSTVAQSSETVAVNTSSNLPEPNLYSNLQNKQKEETSIDGYENTNTTIAQTDSEITDSEIENQLEEETNAIETAIAEVNDIDEKEKEEEKLSRWNITPNVAPVYFNTLGKGSPIHEQFVDNTKSGEVNMSYGIAGSYAINKKLKVRVGINKVDLGYSTNNIIAYNSIDAQSSARAQIENINFNGNADNTTLLSAENISSLSSPEVLNVKEKGSIDQEFGFIEIPVEVEYALVNKKLGLNVIGGFSTFFVNQNEVYSIQEGNRMLIGEASNINDMSYSANLGLGVNYNVSKKIKVNLEPMFKYQINTFNNSAGDFKPYFIGVYTGLSYKF